MFPLFTLKKYMFINICRISESYLICYKKKNKKIYVKVENNK